MRSRMYRLLLVLPLVLSAGQTRAQKKPAPTNPLKDLIARYASLRSYQDKTSISMRLSGVEEGAKFDVNMETAFVRPNQLRIWRKQSEDGGTPEESLLVSDGKKMWALADKRYAEIEAPTNFFEEVGKALWGDAVETDYMGLDMFGIQGNGVGVVQNLLFKDAGIAEIWLRTARDIKSVGVQQVSGKACRIVSWHIDLNDLNAVMERSTQKNVASLSPEEKKKVKELFKVTGKVIPVKASIGKEDGLIYRIEADISAYMRMVMGAINAITFFGGPPTTDERVKQEIKKMKSLKFIVTETHSEVKVNGEIAPSVFTFTPPDGATKVDNIAAVMGGRD